VRTPLFGTSGRFCRPGRERKVPRKQGGDHLGLRIAELHSGYGRQFAVLGRRGQAAAEDTTIQPVEPVNVAQETDGSDETCAFAH